MQQGMQQARRQRWTQGKQSKAPQKLYACIMKVDKEGEKIPKCIQQKIVRRASAVCAAIPVQPSVSFPLTK